MERNELPLWHDDHPRWDHECPFTGCDAAWHVGGRLLLTIVAGCLLAALACAARGQESPALNGRGVALNDAREGLRTAPRSRVGVLLNFRTHDAHRSARNDFWIDRWPTADQRAQGACSSWHEYFRRVVDPISVWLEGDSLRRSAIYDLEGPWGHSQDYRRYFAIDELVRNERYGLWWRNEGLIECCRLYADGGAEVVIHTGCADSAGYAAGLCTTAGGREELLTTLYRVHGPLVGANIRIGHDAAAACGPGSVTHAEYRLLEAVGAQQQIEGTPELSATHWKGATCRLAWSEFHARHVEQAPWAVGRWPLANSAEFAAWYGDVRVHVTATSFGCDPAGVVESLEKRRAWLKQLARGTRELLAETPVTVLLDDWIIREALRSGDAKRAAIAVEEFLPEEAR